MRLLVTTQALDQGDPALAFFHEWVVLLAGHYETLEVICLKEGAHELPSNVHVYSLGKERGTRSPLIYAARFYRTLWRLRGRYDAVFVHMNPEYAVLGGLLWRATGKRIVLWYTHRNVDVKLRIALRFAHAVATAAPESFRITSPKVRVIGHGIDTNMFATRRDGALHVPLALLTVGRITPIKRLEILIDALALLTERGVDARLTIAGTATVARDMAYEHMLRNQTHERGLGTSVDFHGALRYAQMPSAYHAHDVLVNLAPTGGIDKAVLEAMAAGCIPIVANEAFRPLFKEDADDLVFDGSAEDLAEKIEALRAHPYKERAALIERLALRAREEADLTRVIDRLVALITSR